MSTQADVIEDLLARAAHGFERDAAVLSGDDERIERIERAVQRRYGARPRSSRMRQVAVAVAIGMLLTGAALGALRVAGLLEPSEPARAPAAAPPPGAVLPSGGGAQRGPRSLPAPVEPPQPELTAPVPNDAPSAEALPQPVASRGATHVTPAVAPSGAASPEAPPSPPLEAAAKRFDDPPSDEAASAATLFAAANRARVSGNVAQAIQLSQQLLGKFPRSAEATSTRLSLGMLLLQQGRAAEALTQLQAYEQQASGATLAEALWGKAQALQRLGRANEERAALSQLLARFPNGAFAAAAQKRLAQLP